MPKILKEIIRYIVVILLLVASIYFVFKDIDMQVFINTFIQARWEWCLLSVPVAILSHLVRAIRWRIFLKPIHNAQSTLNLFSAVMIGYVVNNIIPRGGEFVRPFVYARREKVSKTAVFATIVAERIIDVIFLLLMFAFAFFLSRDTISRAFPWLTSANITYLLIALVACIVLLFLLLATNLFEFLIEKILKPIFPKKYDRIHSIWASFRKGFEILKTPSQYFSTFLYSAAIWILYALPMYLMFFAFDFQNYLHLGLADAGLLIVVSGVGTSIAPTPGAIGVYHWLIVSALIHLYPAITQEEALAYATLTHGVNLIIQVAVGSFFLLRENLRKLPTKEDFQ